MFDRIVSIIVLGTLAPLIFFTAGWWGSYVLGASDITIIICSLVGLLVGVLLDFAFLRRYLSHLFFLPLGFIIFADIAYSFFAFVYSMGFPVLVTIVGISSIYATAKRARNLKQPAEKSTANLRLVKKISLITLSLLCAVSAFLALTDKYIGSEVAGILHLTVGLTDWMIWVIILAGTVMLLAIEYFSGEIISDWALKRKKPSR